MGEMTYTASDVIVYSRGPVAASACHPAGMPLEQVTAAVNFHLGPTGLKWGWAPSKDPTFSGGQPNPCPCNSDEARLHRLYNC